MIASLQLSNLTDWQFKGQKISKANYLVLISSKNMNEIPMPQKLGQNLEKGFRSFFERNENKIICF